MRIGICGLRLLPGSGRRGIDNYTFQLMRMLPAARPDDQFVYYVRSDCHDLDELESAQVRFCRLPLPQRSRQLRLVGRILVEQFVQPFLANRDALDVLHFPDNSISVLVAPQCPVTMTLHDLMIYSHPHTFSGLTKIYKALTVAPSIRKVQRIISVSSFSRDELRHKFPEALNKTTVSFLATADHFRRMSPAEIEAHLASFNLTAGSYFLYLGPVEYRKNVDGLIEAYAKAVDRMAQGAKSPKLVIAGRITLMQEALAQLPAKFGVENLVQFTGFVSDEAAVALYNGAICSVYPSWFEGFGLPILEAMRCGTPVVTSNSSSMTEVAGGAAILVDPGDTESIAAALILVAEQPALRARMSEMGAERVSQFSWLRTAIETASIWDDLA